RRPAAEPGEQEERVEPRPQRGVAAAGPVGARTGGAAAHAQARLVSGQRDRHQADDGLQVRYAAPVAHRRPTAIGSTAMGGPRARSFDDLAAGIGEDIGAEAEVLRRGKEIAYADLDVRNDGGKRIAKGLVTYRALDHPPAGAERQRATRAEPAAAGGEVPKLARAIVSVPFMASLGLAITHMQDGHAVVHMPLTPDKTDHDGAIRSEERRVGEGA